MHFPQEPSNLHALYLTQLLKQRYANCDRSRERSRLEKALSSRKITIHDVAERAGVSYQTVSRVINNRPDVSDDTRLRILQVIDDLGYRPNAVARSLVSSKTHTLGLITADFSDYFFTQVIVGAEAEARQHGYFFMLSSTERNPSDEPEYLRMLTEQRVEGILFARPSTELARNTAYLQRLVGEGIPVVMTAVDVYSDLVSIVDIDNFEGGRQAVGHLIALGHTDIALIAGPPGWRSVGERTRGYHYEHEAAGLPVDHDLTEMGDWSYESGYEAAMKLVRRCPNLTAVFAHNDQMAIGAIAALRTMGRAVPKDVAVVGYDNIPVAQFYDPTLTTIHQPAQEVGRTAARLLIDAINRRAADHHEILFKPELIVRQSSGLPR
jgi:DNA-binding LacI/PurR family transcriptional regulator